MRLAELIDDLLTERLWNFDHSLVDTEVVVALLDAAGHVEDV
ncbi:hypothetical protein [Actinocorallia aurantiaca]